MSSVVSRRRTPNDLGAADAGQTHAWDLYHLDGTQSYLLSTDGRPPGLAQTRVIVDVHLMKLQDVMEAVNRHWQEHASRRSQPYAFIFLQASTNQERRNPQRRIIHGASIRCEQQFEIFDSEGNVVFSCPEHERLLFLAVPVSAHLHRDAHKAIVARERDRLTTFSLARPDSQSARLNAAIQQLSDADLLVSAALHRLGQVHSQSHIETSNEQDASIETTRHAQQRQRI